MPVEQMKTVFAAGIAGELMSAVENHVPGLEVWGVQSREELQEALEQSADTRFPLILLGEDVADAEAAGCVQAFQEAAGRTPAVIRFLPRDGVQREGEPREEEPRAWHGSASRLLYAPVDVAELCRAVADFAGLPCLSPEPDAFGQARKDLWERHKETIIGRITVLKQAGEALQAGTMGWTLRREARGEAHKLAGSLGSFGFDEGSRIARELEEHLNQDETPAEDDIRTYCSVIGVLERSIGGTAAQRAPKEAHKLLIVDGDPTVTAMLVEEARTRGLESVVAPNPDAARRSLAQPCAAVILDPAGEAGIEAGLDLLRDLAASGQCGPVVVSTAQASLVDRLRAVRLGAAAFLPKPVARGQVIAAALRAMAADKPGGAAILGVDDDPAVLALLEALLTSAGHRFTPLATPLKFWAALEAGKPDLIVLDLDMPVLGGIELCRVLRNDPRWRHVPVLFLTADRGADAIRRVFAAGADDFVAKPFVGPELLARIRNRLERSRLLEHGQDSDPVTGLPTRRRGSEALARLLEQADRTEQTLAFAVLETDHLRTLKARHGHDLADDIGRRLADLLVLALPAPDVVSRWSETFVLGLLATPAHEAIRRLNQVQAELHELEFEADNRRGLRAFFSAGVAQYPEDAANLADLFRAADRALGEAQAGGGGKVVRAVWHPSEGRHVEHLDVVVVEDDEALAGLVVHELKRHRLTYRWLMDGRAALDGLAGSHPPLAARAVVLDLNLPLIDGMALLDRLRRDGVLKRTKVLVSTTDSGKANVLKALELGAADYLVKPYSLETLMDRLYQVLTPGQPGS